MAYQYKKHYTRDEARELLVPIRGWIKQLQRLDRELTGFDNRIAQLLKTGADAGGELVNNWVRTLTAIKKVHQEFVRRQIILKDLDRGLIDFPSLRGEREIFLCWEQDEEDIEFWHELDAGYAGRERI
jgi:hypothetical protein